MGIDQHHTWNITYPNEKYMTFLLCKKPGSNFIQSYPLGNSSNFNQAEDSTKKLSPLIRIRNRDSGDTIDIDRDPGVASSSSEQARKHNRTMPLLNHFQTTSCQMPNFPATNMGSHTQDILFFGMSGILQLCRISITKIEGAIKKNGRNFTSQKLLGSSSDLVEWKLLRDPSWSEVLGVIEGVEFKDSDPKWPGTSWVNGVETFSYSVPPVSLWSSSQFHFQTYMSPDKLENWDEALHLPLTQNIDAINRCTVPYGVEYLPKCATDLDLNLATMLEENMLEAIGTDLTSTSTSTSIPHKPFHPVQELRAEYHENDIFNNLGGFLEEMHIYEDQSELGDFAPVRRSDDYDPQTQRPTNNQNTNPSYDLDWPESDDEVHRDYFCSTNVPREFTPSVSKARENHTDSSTDDDEVFLESCPYPSLPPRGINDSRREVNRNCQISDFSGYPYTESAWTPQPQLQNQDSHSWARLSRE
ncbi:hypothetical protein K493DRAFT_298616 [Basidiobolus meristosporus CBS 931.73]|uniref:BCAS3 domain-containing protein n=1 Tax=Basidiobolus meristosporus CBS 931.73 TaxID=1314790 RepID=A0A1Y1YSB9_9FUNG|nr:hypothetical protein K493DRAFT_298616 [Basidiobolus meristosporus CBS 931.73]|eukprot:ORY00920.1 hypothetical protein K493DRAFT_298616 [Basidiobolus meristosporus CBS 931.73]